MDEVDDERHRVAVGFTHLTTGAANATEKVTASKTYTFIFSFTRTLGVKTKEIILRFEKFKKIEVQVHMNMRCAIS